jgi:hypothetical protein
MFQAYLLSVFYDPETKLADEAVVVVEFGLKKARIHVDLEPTPTADPNISTQATRLLQELGKALRHIRDTPLATGASAYGV